MQAMSICGQRSQVASKILRWGILFWPQRFFHSNSEQEEGIIDLRHSLFLVYGNKRFHWAKAGTGMKLETS